MKKTKKFLSILLATILIFSLFPATLAHASDNKITFSAEADKVDAKAGDIVNVDICMSENSVVAALTLVVNYDNTALKIVDVKSKEAFGYEEFNTAYGENQLAYLTASANPKTVGGTLFTIQFEVLKDGCTEISLSVNELTDIDLQPIPSLTQSAEFHDYDYENGVLTRPTETEKGYYTYTCKNDANHTTTETVESADYTEYNKALKKVNDYLSDSSLPSETKQFFILESVKIIQNNSEFFDSDLKERRDLIASEQYIIDKITNELNELFQVVDSIIVSCEAGNHDVREYTPDNNAACIENGTKRGTCYFCGVEVVVDDEDNPALGHDIIVDNAVSPDCINTGLAEGSHCSRCDDMTVEQEIVPALGHSYNSVVTPPTCTEAGYTTYTCTVCGDTYVDDETQATGHSYKEEITTPATHTENGVMTYTCHCGDTYTEIINATGDHYYVLTVKEPTCTEGGYTTYTCACGDTYVDDETSANGHDYNAVVTEPTCTETGYTTYTCTVCDDTYVDGETPANGHSFSNGNCTVCGETDPDYYVFSVKTPSRTTIRNKDGIILHKEITGNAPAGSYVEWTSNNNNFNKTVMNDGDSLRVIANNKGNTTFTATLYDANGNELATDSVELYSDSGFFQKIGGFFRSLFGTTKIHEN